MADPLDHPDHYNRTEAKGEDGTSPFEVIKLIEDWKLGFSLGNALKYILRAPYKGRQTEDLRKAVWYLRRAKDRCLEDAAKIACDGRESRLKPKAACAAWKLAGYLTEVVCFIHDRDYDEALKILDRLVAESKDDAKVAKEPPIGYGCRKRLPDERESITHHYNIRGVDGYVTVGLYSEGRPGEIFTTIWKRGTALSCMMDAWAAAVSIGLQHGVPLETFTRKFSWVQFEPQGLTTNKDIKIARSPLDYVARWLSRRFDIDEAECLIEGWEEMSEDALG